MEHRKKKLYIYSALVQHSFIHKTSIIQVLQFNDCAGSYQQGDPKGERGDKGYPGVPGRPGAAGLAGEPGLVLGGLKGQPGLSGDDGLAGYHGIPGTPGSPGERQLIAACPTSISSISIWSCIFPLQGLISLQDFYLFSLY